MTEERDKKEVVIELDEDEYKALINLVHVALWFFEKKKLAGKQLVELLEKEDQTKDGGEVACKG